MPTRPSEVGMNPGFGTGSKPIRLTLVPGGGVEPPRPEGRRILSPLRLPVPPSRLFVQVPDVTGLYCIQLFAIQKQITCNCTTNTSQTIFDPTYPHFLKHTDCTIHHICG